MNTRFVYVLNNAQQQVGKVGQPEMLMAATSGAHVNHRGVQRTRQLQQAYTTRTPELASHYTTVSQSVSLDIQHLLVRLVLTILI